MIELLRNWFNRHFSDPQIVILGFLLLAGFALVFWLGDILAPALAALVIAYLLDGMVVWLERFRLPRLACVIIVFLIFMASMVVLLVVLLPLLSSQIGQLAADIPSIIGKVREAVMKLPEKYPDLISQSQIRQLLDMVAKETGEVGKRLVSISLASVKGAITLLVYLVLVPLMVFFFLKDKYKLMEWIGVFLPKDRKLAVEVWSEVNLQIGNYLRGKLWEILIVWSVSYVTFKILGLRFAMLQSLFVGLSVLIPYIGATLMYIPILLIAYFQWGWSSNLATVFIAYSIIQLLDGNLLVHLLMSGVVNLHPIAIILAVLVFGGLWGIWGLFFAIPLATLVHAVIKAWNNQAAELKKERKHSDQMRQPEMQN